ncbi:MAG: HEPN family nuclease [Smithella sp.]|jgi:hypothetical protein
MGAIEKYKIEIVKRTKEILQDFYPTFIKEDREVTFLMNCLLGLIIAITEAEKIDKKLLRGKIDEEFIRNIPDKVGFIQLKRIDLDLADKDLTEINLNVGHKSDLLGRYKLWFITRLRNCIAHQNIYGINEDSKWICVRLWNINNSKKDFEIVFTIDELKNYAIELATKYLETNQQNIPINSDRHI